MRNLKCKFLVFALVLLLVSGFAFSGCMGEEEDEIIDDSLVSIGEEDVVEEEEVDDEEPVLEEEVDTDVEEEPAEEVEKEEEEEEVEREKVEFEDGDKFLEGATSEDGARVVSYNYGIEGGVFKFVWGVRGSDAEPTPEVRAKYNADNDIIVVFPDLESDYIAVDSDDFEVPGVSDSVSWKRSGDESMYKFEFDNQKEYSLEALSDEGEVVLEIQL